MVPLNMSDFDRLRFSGDSFISLFFLQMFQLVVSDLILVPIQQSVLILFWFLTMLGSMLGVDETFYRYQISACTCVPVSMK